MQTDRLVVRHCETHRSMDDRDDHEMVRRDRWQWPLLSHHIVYRFECHLHQRKSNNDLYSLSRMEPTSHALPILSLTYPGCVNAWSSVQGPVMKMHRKKPVCQTGQSKLDRSNIAFQILPLPDQHTSQGKPGYRNKDCLSFPARIRSRLQSVSYTHLTLP